MGRVIVLLLLGSLLLAHSQPLQGNGDDHNGEEQRQVGDIRLLEVDEDEFGPDPDEIALRAPTRSSAALKSRTASSR